MSSAKPMAYSKKQIERELFDRFAKSLGGVPEGRVEDDQENPDIRVHLADGRVLGFELTELFWETPKHGRPEQEREALLSRIAQEARRRYLAKGLPPVHVSLMFRFDFAPSLPRMRELAARVADLVARNLPAEGGSISEEYDWDNRDYFPEELLQVSVHRFARFTETFFGCSGASFIPPLTRTDVLRAMVPKEARVEAYRRAVQEVWLVICCDGGGLSGFFDFQEEAVSEPFATKFDRVFLFRKVAGRVHELARLHPQADKA